MLVTKNRGSRNGLIIILGMLWLFSLACSNDPTKPDGGLVVDGCTGAGTMVLSVVGDPSLIVYPNQKVELKVTLLAKCEGGRPNEPVQFEIVGNPGDSQLSSTVVNTQTSGLAKVELTTGANVGQFQVQARHAQDPNGVYFSIDLREEEYQIEVESSRNEQVYINDTRDLLVRVTKKGSKLPAYNFAVSFYVQQPATGDGLLLTAQSITNVQGIASTAFQTGSQPSQYTIIAEGTHYETGQAQFYINVRQRTTCSSSTNCPNGEVCVAGYCYPTGGKTCTTNDHCPDGFICDNYICRPEGALPGTCVNSRDCPNGYYCENYKCFPCMPDSTLPECAPGQDIGDACASADDCPPGFVCIKGICYPNNPANVGIPDLGGTWYTEHYFDLSEAMPGSTDTLAEVAEYLNRFLNHCQLTDISFVDEILCDIMDEYVPDWLPTLSSILDNTFKMLSHLWAEGAMQLHHLNPRELVAGTERWDTMKIRYLEACCNCAGKPGDCCNPYDAKDFPDCAVIDIARTELETADVMFRFHPFTGKVRVDDSNPAQKVYTVYIDPREVEIEMAEFADYVVEKVIKLFLGYDSLDAAMQDLIDCDALNSLVEDLLGSYAPDITLACENDLKPDAGEIMKILLKDLTFGWNTLKFSGWGTLQVWDGDDPPYGLRIGTHDYDKVDGSPDGLWKGTFTMGYTGDVTGGWRAER